MSAKQKNQRRAIKKGSSRDVLSPKATRVLRAFETFDSTDEQVAVFARLARILADALDEDRMDHELMDQCRHELADAKPWEQVRQELGLGSARKTSKRR